MHRVRDVAVALAVALAFADTSIVVLGLPEIYGELDASIVGVAWTITTYALVLGVGAVAVGLFLRRRPPTARAMTALGLAAFTAASLVCGAAGSMTTLLVGRALQGLGAALLLIGAARLPGTARSWSIAAAVGATAGPAIGGFLTQAFTWRSIFFVQAPVSALALAAVLAASGPRAELTNLVTGGPHDAASARRTARRLGLARVLADGFLAAALVGALFLSVLLVVEAWRFDPLEGALVVSPLPVGALATRGLVDRIPAAARVVAGAVLLGGGLLGLAYTPVRAAVAAFALLLCGLGFGMLSGGEDESAAAPTVAARHLGLVLGLVITAPLLSSSLEAVEDRAALGGTQVLLDARLDIRPKIDVARELRDEVFDTPKGEVPDIDAAFRRAGSDGDAALALAGDQLGDVLDDIVTRAFRPSFVVAAVMAGIAALFALGALARRTPVLAGVVGPPAPITPARTSWAGWTGPAVVGVVVVVVSAGMAAGLVDTELDDGARTRGDVVLADPCTAPPDTYSGRGLDETVQRLALSALNGAACELGTSRERLVLSLDGGGELSGITWDDATMERALEAGGLRAVDDAEDRGLPRLVAIPIRALIRVAPLRWFLERIDIPDLPDIPFFD